MNGLRPLRIVLVCIALAWVPTLVSKHLRQRTPAAAETAPVDLRARIDSIAKLDCRDVLLPASKDLRVQAARDLCLGYRK